VPVDARSLSSQHAASATSSGVAIRPIGLPASICATTPGEAASQASIISVAVPPGVSPLTRMPSVAQVTAAVSVRLFSARFIAP
jgi:hypothetical protein